MQLRSFFNVFRDTCIIFYILLFYTDVAKICICICISVTVLSCKLLMTKKKKKKRHFLVVFIIRKNSVRRETGRGGERRGVVDKKVCRKYYIAYIPALYVCRIINHCYHHRHHPDQHSHDIIRLLS